MNLTEYAKEHKYIFIYADCKKKCFLIPYSKGIELSNNLEDTPFNIKKNYLFIKRRKLFWQS
jgi:hypothetical protein